jgi:hypothetical protein
VEAQVEARAEISARIAEPIVRVPAVASGTSIIQPTHTVKPEGKEDTATLAFSCFQRHHFPDKKKYL